MPTRNRESESFMICSAKWENMFTSILISIANTGSIFIGDQVIINMNCTFVDNNIIEIGDNVLIASNVQIYTATHSTKLQERVVADWEAGEGICKTYALPVRINDGAWIGGGAIILPGVTIGKNSVIGAGSIVTHSIPDNCVAVGNPCRVIKQIDNEVV